MKKQISQSDILPVSEFTKIRAIKRQEIIKIKQHRRVALGPDVMIYFENYDTLWWQIQEMLYIEKGGDEQLHDELAAYNPLIPQGDELVSTVMIEIEDPRRRSQVLSTLGHFENNLIMKFGVFTIQGQPEEDVERTNEEGKTSSVHFIRWPFTLEMKQTFSSPGCDVIFECTHPLYPHKTILPDTVHRAIIGDFDGI